MEVDLDKELQRVTQQMQDAEDSLITSGFSEAHWLLIRKYITSVILHNQLTTAKAWRDMPGSGIAH